MEPLTPDEGGCESSRAKRKLKPAINKIGSHLRGARRLGWVESTYPPGYLVEDPLPNEDGRKTSDAILAAAVRVSTPSSMKIFSRCLPIVRVPAPRIWPISLFLFP
jgi:hypothetical protein